MIRALRRAATGPARLLAGPALAAAVALVMAGVPAAPAHAATTRAGSAGTSAFVDVAVATVWTSPESPRPVDRPALGNPSDVPGWLAAMSTADKLDLTGSNRTQTQALYGRRVVVLDHRDGWTEIAVPGQPTPKNPAGYPGWVPDAQLSTSPGFAALADRLPTAVVDSAATTWLYADPQRTAKRTEISADTRLPVLARALGSVLVATPSEGPRWLDERAVSVLPRGASAPAPTGADLVDTARMFLARPYLWGGRAGFGLDCSGLTGIVYALHGITVPRDSTAQATGGRRVDRTALKAGDLLFYAGPGGKGTIHHVAMYAGGGQMIEAYDAAHPVRTTPVRLTGEYWGAVRYLP